MEYISENHKLEVNDDYGNGGGGDAASVFHFYYIIFLKLLYATCDVRKKNLKIYFYNISILTSNKRVEYVQWIVEI